MPNALNKINSVLLDVNVCIDLIVNRAISTHVKKHLFSTLRQHNIITYIPAFSIDTIFYILNSSMKIDHKIARNSIQNLLKFTKLLHTNDESIHRAFSSNFSDFEDGLINSLAQENSIDIIITSNISDFSRSSIPVYRPADFITLFD
jgi:predicted nucleic acid-binding protein